MVNPRSKKTLAEEQEYLGDADRTPGYRKPHYLPTTLKTQVDLRSKELFKPL